MHQHIGEYIRAVVLPEGISVKDAAQKMGVGRQALSDLLNGHASLSEQMKEKLVAVFSADLSELEKNVVTISRMAKPEAQPIVAKYVPELFVPKAAQITTWAAEPNSRSDFPVLISKLITSTVDGITSLDFPGYDQGQRKGWDGRLECSGQNPWAPNGLSFWEIGTNEGVKGKANDDYKKAVDKSKLTDEERASIEWIFVTSREWPGKQAWADEKSREGKWKAVRAYDVSDLQQWLGSSLAGQIWLAEKLGFPIDQCMTLDSAWDRWATSTETKLSPKFFDGLVSEHLKPLKDWLLGDNASPFIVSASTQEEACAFIACAMRADEELARWVDTSFVTGSAELIKSLSKSTGDFLPIIISDEAQEELPQLGAHRKVIIFQHPNQLRNNADIELGPVGYETFKNAVLDMGLTEDDAQRLNAKTGRSLTVLRRALSEVPAIRNPRWADDKEFVKTLWPAALIGTWSEARPDDQEIVRCLASFDSYEDYSALLNGLIAIEDAPIWRHHRHVGVVSKVDALYAVASQIGARQLQDFFSMAELVLSEEDPSYDLEERWTAGLFGKTRAHSNEIRGSIRETLIILAVHGGDLFNHVSDFSVEYQVKELIKRLLQPLDIRKLSDQSNDLPDYAEAAPDDVLDIFEADLKQSKPITHGLMRPAGHGPFESPDRSGFLWAMERLAWSPKRVLRVCKILAALSRLDIDDNWVNKPFESLRSIFRSWLPQTAAPVGDRIKVLKKINGLYPDVAWRLARLEFDNRPGFASYNARPIWRDDAVGYGRHYKRSERTKFTSACLEILYQRENYSVSEIDELLRIKKSIAKFQGGDCDAVLETAESWASQNPSDEDRAKIQDLIRDQILEPSDISKQTRLYKFFKSLTPQDMVLANCWLFKDQWGRPSHCEMKQGLGHEEVKKDRDRARLEAISEVHKAGGLDAVLHLAQRVDVPGLVGRFTYKALGDALDFGRLLEKCLTDDEGVRSMLGSYLHEFDQTDSDKLFALIRTGLPALGLEERDLLLNLMPAKLRLWKLIETIDQAAVDHYWREVELPFTSYSPAELNHLIENMLNVGRAHAALGVIRFDWKDIETRHLLQLFEEFVSSPQQDTHLKRLDSWDIENAFKVLDQRHDINRGRLAKLEFQFISVLQDSEYGIPNIERQLHDDPALYVMLIETVFRSKDEPPVDRSQVTEAERSRATAAYRVLDTIKSVPGLNDRDYSEGSKRLIAWLGIIREKTEKSGRLIITDQQLGGLLSRAEADADGQWPNPTVMAALEDIGTKNISTGFQVGVYNSRGGHMREPTGNPERELAAKYRAYAEPIAVEYPFTASVLEELARMYDHDAHRADEEGKLRGRLEGW